jgi:hypothetical protein
MYISHRFIRVTEVIERGFADFYDVFADMMCVGSPFVGERGRHVQVSQPRMHCTCPRSTRYSASRLALSNM